MNKLIYLVECISRQKINFLCMAVNNALSYND